MNKFEVNLLVNRQTDRKIDTTEYITFPEHFVVWQ